MSLIFTYFLAPERQVKKFFTETTVTKVAKVLETYLQNRVYKEKIDLNLGRAPWDIQKVLMAIPDAPDAFRWVVGGHDILLEKTGDLKKADKIFDKMSPQKQSDLMSMRFMYAKEVATILPVIKKLTFKKFITGWDQGLIEGEYDYYDPSQDPEKGSFRDRTEEFQKVYFDTLRLLVKLYERAATEKKAILYYVADPRRMNFRELP